MPELPDLENYITALEARISGEQLSGIRISSPFILRSAVPTVESLVGRRVMGFSRIGKRIVITLEEDHFIVIHLMIAGRFRWYKSGAKLPARLGLIAFDFSSGTLVLTEASKKHRASVYLVAGRDNLADFDQGGIDVLEADLSSFISALSKQNHTIKRSLTDQKFVSGIGNAYSDEILHKARISPMRQVRFFTDGEWRRLYEATREVLRFWVLKHSRETGDDFPLKVTAFHPDMSVHGKYRQPCPDCGNPVQRIRYANNECNYCAACQNQGNILADRGLSRLLKKDWPRTLEELDEIAAPGESR